MSNDRVEVFRDSAGEWRWHKIAPNNKVVSTSGESFDSRENAERAAARERKALAAAGPQYPATPTPDWKDEPVRTPWWEPLARLLSRLLRR